MLDIDCKHLGYGLSINAYTFFNQFLMWVFKLFFPFKTDVILYCIRFVGHGDKVYIFL